MFLSMYSLSSHSQLNEKHSIYFYYWKAGSMSKWLFTASNIKYPAAYLSCFYINSIKMQGLALFLFSPLFLLPLYISVHPPLFFWTCYIIVCLSASFQILPVMCLLGPGCFHNSMPSEHILSLSLSLN